MEEARKLELDKLEAEEKQRDADTKAAKENLVEKFILEFEKWERKEVKKDFEKALDEMIDQFYDEHFEERIERVYILREVEEYKDDKAAGLVDKPVALAMDISDMRILEKAISNLLEKVRGKLT
jgi:hypothetical protein